LEKGKKKKDKKTAFLQKVQKHTLKERSIYTKRVCGLVLGKNYYSK
jgi:hypothetical protein